MTEIRLPYWKTINWIIIIIVVIVIILTITSCGKAYDCGKLREVPEAEFMDALRWCHTDPTKDFTKNEYGQRRSCKTGEWEN